MNVADLLDLSEMELTAKVGEMDRANLKEGQAHDSARFHPG